MKKPSKHLVQPRLNTPFESLFRLAFALLLLMAAAPHAAMAQATPTPPERMSYQGFVTDGNGVALGTNTRKTTTSSSASGTTRAPRLRRIACGPSNRP